MNKLKMFFFTKKYQKCLFNYSHWLPAILLLFYTGIGNI